MVGIIGAGNMGKAIASRLKERVLLSDIDPAKLRFKKSKRISIARDNVDLTNRVRTIILAIKPQDMAGVLKEIAPFCKKRLIISIAAGVETRFIEKILGRVKVVRVMPNMPAMVGKGISAIASGRFANKTDIKRVCSIFSNLGDVVKVTESLMHTITALSGSGPAYYFLFTSLLEKAGISCGLKRALARKLIQCTFIGAAESASILGISMDDFIKRIASKGGTTEAALRIFKKEKLERIIKKAVIAARNRSIDLSKSFAGQHR